MLFEVEDGLSDCEGTDGLLWLHERERPGMPQALVGFRDSASPELARSPHFGHAFSLAAEKPSGGDSRVTEP